MVQNNPYSWNVQVQINVPPERNKIAKIAIIIKSKKNAINRFVAFAYFKNGVLV